MHTFSIQNTQFSFQDLFNPQQLSILDLLFLEYLKSSNPFCYETLQKYRAGDIFEPPFLSDFLIECAKYLETFVAELFSIQGHCKKLQENTLSDQVIFHFKKWFVQRRARRRLTKLENLAEFSVLDHWINQQISLFNIDNKDKEFAIAQLGQIWLSDQTTYANEIEQLTQWCIRILTDNKIKETFNEWVSFRLPEHLDYQQLVPLKLVENDVIGRKQGTLPLKRREGFNLTDQRMRAREIASEIDYCVFCHDKAGDFCSKGFPLKKDEPNLGFKTNPLGITLTGCPLEENISEMHLLKRDGFNIAALAMIMLENPMCPVTGHRICNDCMKSCIYQKQTPVNIPQIETRILSDSLELPYGVEIYDLFTRWNPLRKKQFLIKPYNGLKVLIAGMGPSGFSLAHHLLMEGFAVVGIEGLKIEPLPKNLLEKPIISYHELEEKLEQRITTGFGGVAEYGITVRWDKNFLKLIYLSLLRRPYFQIYGSVRFGGTITVEDAWKLGFDHVAIAVGAGLPQALNIPHSLARGMRQANDFLMALQLTGAYKANSLANLQIRLPAIVIGGGLTGVDTATEVQAYYIMQVEKILNRYEELVEQQGENFVLSLLDEEAKLILEEFLEHGRAIREEKLKEKPNCQQLIQQWGGVTIVYRKNIEASPAYLSNHEELIKAFEEGIFYLENYSPTEVKLDRFEHVSGLVCQHSNTKEIITLPCKAIFVATGARPNIAYEFEHRGTFNQEKMQYQFYHLTSEQTLQLSSQITHCKASQIGAFTSYNKGNKKVTFLGDTHPIFHGNVVKAVASAKKTYPQILELFGNQLFQKGDQIEYQLFHKKLKEKLSTYVVDIKRHTSSVLELTIHAPMAAEQFRAGQFFRLQTYEQNALQLHRTLLQTEPMAVLGAGVNKEEGIVSIMVLEQGASSRLCALLKKGDPIALMGPTGVKTKIPDSNVSETVLFLGGRLGAADIKTVGLALRKAGCKVLYLAGFRNAEEVYCQTDLEMAADVIIWITENGKPVKATRPQDRSITGDFNDILESYAKGELHDGEPPIPLQTVDRVLIVGSSRLVSKFKQAQQTFLEQYLIKKPQIIASVHSSMQCTLKGVCAQCLQWQVDPISGERTKAVFACSWHNQPIEIVDWHHLEERLKQNNVQEHLSNLWLSYLFERYKPEKI
jgi:NADPH-dependent glutamate synthase beta subunit-like oxidoreductase/NAD(P)H-flavin reductase